MEYGGGRVKASSSINVAISVNGSHQPPDCIGICQYENVKAEGIGNLQPLAYA